MILRGIPRKQKLASYTGRVMIDTVRGVLRVRKWPKKRGTPTSERQLFWIDWFRQANELAKYADPMSQVRAIEEAKVRGMYPRDVLLKAMRGRLYTWADSDGWKWFSVAAIQDISDTLDVLHQTVGGVLVRALDRWRSPDLGVIDDVLTLKGDPPVPAWATGGGGGIAFGGALVGSLADQAILNQTWTNIIFDAETYDTDAIHDNATNPTRLTVPAGWSHIRLDGNNEWVANSSGERIKRFMKNGADFVGSSWNRALARGTSEQPITSPVIEVVPGDYFEYMVWQSRGVTHNVVGPSNRTVFAMQRIA